MWLQYLDALYSFIDLAIKVTPILVDTGLVSRTFIDNVGRLIGVIQKPAWVSKADMVPPLE
jgi:hypothetical protein